MTPLLLALACSPTRWPDRGSISRDLPAPVALPAGAFEVSWDGEQLAVRHSAQPHTLFETPPGESFVAAGTGESEIHEVRGSFFVEDELELRCEAQTVSAVEADGDAVVIRGTLGCGRGEEVSYTLRFAERSDRELGFALSVDDDRINRTRLRWASPSDEHIVGFGEQFSEFDMKGKRLPVFVMEQGIGRGAQPLTAAVNLIADSGGDWHTSYAGVPHFLTSTNRSLYLDTWEHAVFDLRARSSARVELMGPALSGGILRGSSPAELIAAYTAATGRMRPLPDWLLQGAVVGMQGGSEKVAGVWEELKSRGTPVAGLWLQDWEGQRITSFGKQLWWNWELDHDRYPDWEAMVADLDAAGAGVLTYANPFLADVSEKENARRNLFQEAAEAGYLVRKASGEPYMILNTSFSAWLLDLSNPAARDWMKQVLIDEVVGAGARGWMADFGEALPTDAVLFSGEDAATWHNRYPEEWARLNREVVDEVEGGEDIVFFSRSGYTRSPGLSTLFWLGDQTVTWDEDDGLKSAIIGLLSGGVSGYAFNHSDIGGYTTITHPVLNVHREEELLLRWMEHAAFTVVYRTHEGNIPDANAQFYDSERAWSHFDRFARVYAAWGPYRDTLVAEAAATGLPVARHPAIVYPEHDEAWGFTHEQYFLGEELLVAPVQDPRADKVKVWLPPGRWVHLWTGEVYGDASKTSRITLDAPMGQPGVLYPEGSAVGAAFVAALRAEGLL